MVNAAVKTAAGPERTNMPRNKVIGATLGSAIAGLLISGLNRYFEMDIGPEEAVSITTIVTFIVGWLVPPGRDETTI